MTSDDQETDDRGLPFTTKDQEIRFHMLGVCQGDTEGAKTAYDWVMQGAQPPLHGSEAIKALVDRFLAWPLPKSVRSDLCVTEEYPHPRSGTNLLTADEARQMFEYLFAARS